MTKTHLLILWALIAAQLALGLILVNRLPPRIPIHWDIHGRADGYGSWAAAVTLPAMCTFVSAMLMVLPLIGPLRENLERSKAAYGSIAIVVIGFLTVVHICTLLIALGVNVPMIRIMMVATGIMYALVGRWIGKLRRNWWAGIRTPWTLASDVVWERTHQAAGKMFLVVGIAIAAIGLIVASWIAVIALIASTLAVAVWSLAYSYHVHRQVTGATHEQ
jgi:uncharacterized membrane protein